MNSDTEIEENLVQLNAVFFKIASWLGSTFGDDMFATLEESLDTILKGFDTSVLKHTET
jgi:hypothetical protein